MCDKRCGTCRQFSKDRSGKGMCFHPFQIPAWVRVKEYELVDINENTGQDCPIYESKVTYDMSNKELAS